MSQWRDIYRHIERLESRLTNALQAIVEFTPITRTSADGTNDGVNMPASDGDGASVDPKDRERPVARTTPFGLDSRPVSGANILAAVVKAVAGPFNGLVVGVQDPKYRTQSLAEGEVTLYCMTNGTRVYLDKNGVVHIDAADGQDIILNGGNAKVARVGDHTTAHTHTVTFALTAPPGGGSVTGTITLADSNPTIAEGAEHVLA